MVHSYLEILRVESKTATENVKLQDKRVARISRAKNNYTLNRKSASERGWEVVKIARRQ